MPYLFFYEISVFGLGISSGRKIFLTLTSACKVCPSFSLVCGFPGLREIRLQYLHDLLEDSRIVSVNPLLKCTCKLIQHGLTICCSRV